MGNLAGKIAVYTTVYPGVEAFLPAWSRSVREQSDRDFELWIGLDSLSVDAAIDAMGGDPGANWVNSADGDTPAQVRQRALERVVENCDGVVLVDSDDVLHPSRVAAAREALGSSDLAGCALRLVDQDGADLGLKFGLSPTIQPDVLLPRNNVFGFSNSALRSELLRLCLPIPPVAVLVDWLFATKAWLYGARLTFDRTVRMDYRQYGANMTQVRPPFDDARIVSDTERVLHHFQIVRDSSTFGALPDRLAEFENVAADVESFYRKIALRPAELRRYAGALNALELEPLWWVSVAHPALRQMWTH